jgi:hypothetical protein
VEALRERMFECIRREKEQSSDTLYYRFIVMWTEDIDLNKTSHSRRASDAYQRRGDDAEPEGEAPAGGADEDAGRDREDEAGAMRDDAPRRSGASASESGSGDNFLRRAELEGHRRTLASFAPEAAEYFSLRSARENSDGFAPNDGVDPMDTPLESLRHTGAYGHACASLLQVASDNEGRIVESALGVVNANDMKKMDRISPMAKSIMGSAFDPLAAMVQALRRSEHPQRIGENEAHSKRGRRAPIQDSPRKGTADADSRHQRHP